MMPIVYALIGIAVGVFVAAFLLREPRPEQPRRSSRKKRGSCPRAP
jgi:hypothetical protein